MEHRNVEIIDTEHRHVEIIDTELRHIEIINTELDHTFKQYYFILYNSHNYHPHNSELLTFLHQKQQNIHNTSLPISLNVRDGF